MSIIKLSENLRWEDVPELQLQKNEENYKLDANGNKIHFQQDRSLKGPNFQIGYTPEMVQEIFKCQEDIIYFCNNYIQANTSEGFKHITARDYQEDQLRSFEKDYKHVLLWSRQSNKSSTIAFFILYSIIFGKDLSFGIAANKQGMAREVLDKVKESFVNLPMWLQQGIKVWNANSILLENNCKINISATSASSFRGMTFSSEYLLKRKNSPDIILSSGIIVDEIAFIPKNIYNEFITSVLPTVSAGKHSRIFFASTPCGMNHFHKIWQDAKNKRSGFIPSFVPYWKVPGRDNPKWAEEKLAELGGDKVKFAQEYSCSFSGSSYTLIDLKYLSNIPKIPPIIKLEGLLKDLKVYSKPIKDHSYIIGVDSAKYKGDNFDFSSVQVIDISSKPFKQVATLRVPNITYLDLVPILNEIGTYYNNGMIFIENNAEGQSVADLLWETYEYENIYAEKYGVFGFRTTPKSRKIGLQNLKKFIESTMLELQDESTIEELFHFTLQNGKYQAESGEHDDAVMALVAALYFLQDSFLATPEELMKAIKDKVQNQDPEEDFMGFAFFNDGRDIIPNFESLGLLDPKYIEDDFSWI